ncbi:MAG: tRNA guanosine(34) transglycosylase Tgt [Candidatus Pacebacteria bacterium]|nr:tRNA guanosine(34) transglycosylase Tgt [Candidatus Paceibacterota bacterium]
MNSPFSFTLQKKKGNARVATCTTPHGTFKTPIYMPVGTQATVKALSPEDLLYSKAQIILANTYHLYLRPGDSLIKDLTGLHRFMNWDGPILTDSGGFQVFSLGKQIEGKQKLGLLERTPTKVMSKITDDGVEFSSYLDGSKHFFTPEKAIEIQRNLNSDIVMAFDECTPDTATETYTREALNRTHAWAKRCKDYWEQHERLSNLGQYQALCGIVQGAMHRNLREESAHAIVGMGFDGVAVGGETIGYNMQGTLEIMDWIRPLLPEDKPRYAMGLGRDPQDILDAVRAGFDMFDCVAPTRLARNGALYSGVLDHLDQPNPADWTFASEFSKGRLQIGNARWARDTGTIQEDCDCWTCTQGFSRAYLRHLYLTKELLYYRLASIHNVRFMIRLTEHLQTATLSS